jgi:MPBQ/MSBQ methyltransferase
MYDVAEACCSQQAADTPTSLAASSTSYTPWAVAGGIALALLALKQVYDTPSRSYDNNVGDEYDAWTEEGILEYYWGEHIHLGYYTEAERAAGWWKADFKAAKLRFTQEMFKFSGSSNPKRILDVGCGFGGSSRWLASQFPDAEVVGE